MELSNTYGYTHVFKSTTWVCRGQDKSAEFKCSRLSSELQADLVKQQRGKIADGHGSKGGADDDAKHCCHERLLGPICIRLVLRVCRGKHCIDLVQREVC